MLCRWECAAGYTLVDNTCAGCPSQTLLIDSTELIGPSDDVLCVVCLASCPPESFLFGDCTAAGSPVCVACAPVPENAVSTDAECGCVEGVFRNEAGTACVTICDAFIIFLEH